MGDVLDRMNIRQSAIGRDKLRGRRDDLGELRPETIPVLRIEGADQRLVPQPSVVYPERDIGLLGQTAETLGRQVHVERHRDATNDASL